MKRWRNLELIHIEDPFPLEYSEFREYEWPVDAAIDIKPYIAPTGRSFVDVFEKRRSSRDLQSAPLELVTGALLYALAPRAISHGDRVMRTRRPTISAGALHPISVILFDQSAAFRLNADELKLERLKYPNESRLNWLTKCRRVLPDAKGAFLVLVADMARPRSGYANCESLVLRDAGALLQTIGLVSELFGLGYCPMGILGTEVVDALPCSQQLMPLGAAAIGWPLPHSPNE